MNTYNEVSNARIALQDILATVKDRHLSLTVQRKGYAIVEYTRTDNGLQTTVIVSGTLPELLAYAETLYAPKAKPTKPTHAPINVIPTNAVIEHIEMTEHGTTSDTIFIQDTVTKALRNLRAGLTVTSGLSATQAALFQHTTSGQVIEAMHY